HGYAATIHKAQGMTVDRTHVLATPGVDTHGSYVSLSRHRDGTDLHYGRDDFASQDKLVNILSRDRSKDMATDYDPAQDYAERRGTAYRARVAQTLRKRVPGDVRERIDATLDGLRSPGDAGPDREPVRQPERENAGKEAEIDPEAALRRARGRAFVRHARAVDAILRAQAQDIAATPEQIEELQEARTGFDKLRPHGSHDAEAVYKRSPELATEAASGDRDRALSARRALQLETEMRQNPNMRADRFIERFQELKQSGERQY